VLSQFLEARYAWELVADGAGGEGDASGDPVPSRPSAGSASCRRP